MKRLFSTFTGMALMGLMLLLFSAPLLAAEITGVVFDDLNKNLKLDSGEKGIAGVVVSNQREVAQTDAKGHYTLPVTDETVIFITKPAGYMTPLDQNNLPQFYYIHQPEGTPVFKYKGVDPTGPLPKSLNFPLFKVEEPDNFEVLVFSDPQALNVEELEYVRDDAVAELVGSKAAFGITLGDIVFDDLSLYDKYNAIVGQIGIPFYNVPGNHDENYDSADDHYAMETFKRVFGPPYYSFDYGKVHFIVLDDIEWHGKTEERRGWYQGMIGEKQLEWLKNDLQFVPKDKLVVLTMHIPLKTILSSGRGSMVNDRDKLFELLKDREHLLALAGHTHMIEHDFFDEKDGWKGEKPLHQLVCATVSGSWWGGPKDERGIPITDGRDGTPNGYHIFQFEGNNYTERFKAASKGENHQLRVSLPVGKVKKEDLATTKIVVNVFDGSERSMVQCQLDEFPAIEMQKELMKDPYFQEVRKRHDDTFRSWVEPRPCTHLWTAPLPANLKPGLHRITVQITDQFSQSYRASRIFEVE